MFISLEYFLEFVLTAHRNITVKWDSVKLNCYKDDHVFAPPHSLVLKFSNVYVCWACLRTWGTVYFLLSKYNSECLVFAAKSENVMLLLSTILHVMLLLPTFLCDFFFKCACLIVTLFHYFLFFQRVSCLMLLLLKIACLLWLISKTVHHMPNVISFEDWIPNIIFNDSLFNVINFQRLNV